MSETPKLCRPSCAWAAARWRRSGPNEAVEANGRRNESSPACCERTSASRTKERTAAPTAVAEQLPEPVVSVRVYPRPKRLLRKSEEPAQRSRLINE